MLLLVRTEKGAIRLGLCSALRECFPNKSYAVEVLLGLSRLTNSDAKSQPSSHQWRRLLDACSGAFATSTFPLYMEMLMRLFEDSSLRGPGGPLLTI